MAGPVPFLETRPKLLECLFRDHHAHITGKACHHIARLEQPLRFHRIPFLLGLPRRPIAQSFQSRKRRRIANGDPSLDQLQDLPEEFAPGSFQNFVDDHFC